MITIIDAQYGSKNAKFFSKINRPQPVILFYIEISVIYNITLLNIYAYPTLFRTYQKFGGSST